MSDDEITILRARVEELEAALHLKNGDLIQERLALAADAKVAIYRLRRMVEPHGIKIHSRRGSGWFLDEATKERIRREITSEVSDAA